MQQWLSAKSGPGTTSSGKPSRTPHPGCPPQQACLPGLASWFTLGGREGFPELFPHKALSSHATETVASPGPRCLAQVLAQSWGSGQGRNESAPGLLISRPQDTSLPLT